MFTIKTVYKITLARIACSFILSFRKIWGLSNHAIVQRGGIWWDLDLTEGIDLSIYLLGGFELHTLRVYKKIIKSGYIVLDIGANIGSHTLPLSLLVGKSGRVIAFEPTRYAIDKMRVNISLNGEIRNRISVRQIMLVSSEHTFLESEIYSSWPLFDKGKDLHKDHRGRQMNTSGAVALPLDKALEEIGVPRVDFIKIDVDGYEYRVLAGARQTLIHHRPQILMEFAPYLLDELGEFEQLIGFLRKMNYSILDVNTWNMLPLDPHQLRNLIPRGASRNVLLLPGVIGNNMKTRDGDLT